MPAGFNSGGSDDLVFNRYIRFSFINYILINLSV